MKVVSYFKVFHEHKLQVLQMAYSRTGKYHPPNPDTLQIILRAKLEVTLSKNSPVDSNITDSNIAYTCYFIHAPPSPHTY